MPYASCLAPHASHLMPHASFQAYFKVAVG
jgi:hypothetical protein